MSAGAIYRECLVVLNSIDLPNVAKSDLVAVMERSRPGPLPVINELAYDAGLSPEQVRRRGAACFFCFCAGHLADDMIDGDCDYLNPAQKLGPTAQFTLAYLAISVMLDAAIPADVVSSFARRLSMATAMEHEKTRKGRYDWTFEQYERWMGHTAGHQWAGYLEVLWAGTALEARSENVGYSLGLLSQIAFDIKQQHPRFFTLSHQDRDALLASARTAMASLGAEKLRSVDMATAFAQPYVDACSAAPGRAVVSAYYSSKTQAIVDKYGPGPRIHYHTGWVNEEQFSGDLPALGRALCGAQERTLSVAAERWDAGNHLSGRILDCGAGLGGGSLFWAMKYGAQVHAVTICEEHISVIERMAARANVAHLVTASLCDVHEVVGQYDAAVAIDAACYFDRERWFKRLAQVVRPGGFVFVSDVFLGLPSAGPPFDDLWKTRLGTVDEYQQAAKRAGFSTVSVADGRAQTRAFWVLSIAYCHRQLEDGGLDAAQEAAVTRMIERHTWLVAEWERGGIEYWQLAWRKDPD